MTNDFFAMVRRDEVLVRGVLTETRSGHGQAMIRGNEIVARNRIENATLRDQLHQRCSAEMDRLRRAVEPIGDARVRGVVTALVDDIESTVTISIEGVSIVTTPEHAIADYDALKQLLHRHAPAPRPSRPLPIVWRNGSAAVLLHEAVGHAAEHKHQPLGWPAWLRARDVTRDNRSADLIAGELPLAIRRESFRTVPLRRMTSLVFEQDGAPFELPDERIEVHLVANGAYEPLTEMVTVDVALADLVMRDGLRRITRFAVRGPRSAISRALIGAMGDPIRYPGVICSREGQELFVASHAPVMVTAELA